MERAVGLGRIIWNDLSNRKWEKFGTSKYQESCLLKTVAGEMAKYETDTVETEEFSQMGQWWP
jgi:hypothetical protein